MYLVNIDCICIVALLLQLLKIAVELGIFDALKGSRTATADQLAEELQLKADRLVRFLRSLVTLELLELHDNGTHFLYYLNNMFCIITST